jgi:ubiquinone/menaquinone biosynthesis C-methylase UbiE
LTDFEEIFINLIGGRVLDAATGEGGFIEILQNYLDGCTSIVGIDTSEGMIERARKRFDSQEIHFIQMDAGCIGFEEQSFDTVSISVSLHHLANVPLVLSELRRVLKPGGLFILCEMHRDGMTEAQFNAIRIHHWAASIDTALGGLHDRTYAHQEILDFVNQLNLRHLIQRDLPNADSNPRDEEAIKSIEGYLNQYRERAEAIPHGEAFIQQGEELRQSLHKKGVQREPVLVVIGHKP